ncbi:TetR/AcrR family transcriptional regulator [Actinomadura rugatobispora]|uniref:TetR/AcrR family transcriptional regulator n=1 Tax=Actinomadura rugatobispora TaxID=1994 RepID=A0ABW1A7A5_9ACTN|nr:TetR/AcrR family transcriptional regulator [Actinomadura rugatobispora]
MSTTEIPESGARGRTRRAILAAGASVLARDHGATLADIADAADVGRSTLHRYFADRRELIRAVVDDSLEALERATEEAQIDDGPPVEAMRRLIAAMVGVGERIVFLWGDPRVLEQYGPPTSADAECEGEVPSVDDPVLRLIERGQREGVFDPEVPAHWIQHVIWSLVFTAFEDAESGVLPRHGVTSTIIRTFENGVRVRT